MNVKVIINTMAKVMLIEAALMVLPLAVGFIYGENCVSSIAITIAIAAVLGFVLQKLTKTNTKGAYIKEGFAIACLSWIVMSAIGALPFVFAKEIPNFIDAFFEVVSGFTTTGASILTDVEAMSHGLLFWRSFTHWVGGMGILVFVMAIIENPDRSINIMRAEMPGHALDKFTSKSKTMAKTLYYLYLAITGLEIVFLLLGGMPLFDSLITAFGTAGTGGFGIKADSIASYNAYCQWVVGIFMLLFGVNFNIYYLLVIKKFKNVLESNELWTYIGIAVGATIIISINIVPLYGSLSETVRTAFFQVSSISTTTGFATTNFDVWPQLSKCVLFLLMFSGGCLGSTAGGIKVTRIVVLFQTLKNDVKRRINPRSVHNVRLNGKTIDASEEKNVSSYLALYVFVLIITTLLISFEPFDFESNITAAVSCFNNIGPAFAAFGPTSSYAAYSGFSKLVLSFAMLAGRLEIYPLLVLFARKK